MSLLAVGRVGWLEVGLILILAAIPVLLTLLVAWLARLGPSGDDE